MREKHIKLETFSKETDISKGELSKIINGQRKDFNKHLDIIAKVLGVTELELTTPIIPQIPETPKSTNPDKKAKEELYERLISENKDKIEMQCEIIKDLRSDLHYWKEEFIKLKEKIEQIEKKL